MKPIMLLTTLLSLLLSAVAPVLAHASQVEQAQRHFDRGTVAVEMAATRSDLETAAREFEEAARLAPEWPDVHYNLGLVRERLDDFDGAILSFRRYLDLAPQATDAAAVRSQVNKLEFRRDKQAEQARIPSLLDGVWKGVVGLGGGVTESLRFRNWGNGQVSVELLTTWNADPGVAIDLTRHPVEIEGQNVRFSFRSKLVVPGVLTDYFDIRIELSMVEPHHLKGASYSSGHFLHEVSLEKQ